MKKKMDSQTAIACINYLLIHSQCRNQRLTSLEEEIIRGCWLGQYYKEIAKHSQYSNNESYISNRASQIWNQLSDALGETVRRSCVKTALDDWYQKQGKEILDNNYFPLVQDHDFSDLLEDQSYVHREEEEVCYNALLRPKTCLRLKGLTQVGKTLLIQRTIARLKKKKNFHYVYLSLKEINDKYLSNTEELMRWFAQKITNQLHYNYQFEECWQSSEELGAIVQCTTYFEEYILPYLSFPIVLCIDDVHLLLPYEEVTDSFFRMLRSWLEKEGLSWRQKFRLAIIYTTDIYTSTSINRSPLNIGIAVELSDFNHQEVEALIETYQTIQPSQFGEEGIIPLTHLVNNNPCLLKIALDHLSLYPNQTLSDILENATTDIGIYQNHLRDLWLKLNENPVLENLFREVIIPKRRVSLSPQHSHFLQRMGLVKIFADGVEPRCELYYQYFARYWT